MTSSHGKCKNNRNRSLISSEIGACVSSYFNVGGDYKGTPCLSRNYVEKISSYRDNKSHCKKFRLRVDTQHVNPKVK